MTVPHPDPISSKQAHSWQRGISHPVHFMNDDLFPQCPQTSRSVLARDSISSSFLSPEKPMGNVGDPSVKRTICFCAWCTYQKSEIISTTSFACDIQSLARAPAVGMVSVANRTGLCYRSAGSREALSGHPVSRHVSAGQGSRRWRCFYSTEGKEYARTWVPPFSNLKRGFFVPGPRH